MAVERFYIVRDGRREGPFDEPYVRFLLENDEVALDDECETESGERLRLADLYEPVEQPAPDAGTRPRADQKRPGARGRRGARPEVLYVGHPSYLKYPLAWMVVAAGTAGGYWAGGITLWAMLGGFALATAALGYIVIDRSSNLYMISERRIEAVRGLVAKDSTEIRIDDLRTINVRRHGLRGVLGVGTVEFASAGDAADVAFRDVWGALRIKRLVRRLQDSRQG